MEEENIPESGHFYLLIYLFLLFFNIFFPGLLQREGERERCAFGAKIRVGLSGNVRVSNGKGWD